MLEDKAPSPWSLKEFEGFLRSNHCLESLEFYLDVKKYAREASANDKPDSTRTNNKLHKLWKQIIHTYISIDAPKELNITDDHKRKLTDLAACEASPPSEPSVINQVLEFAIETIRDGVYPQFVNEQSFYYILCARKNYSGESDTSEASVNGSGAESCSCYVTVDTESQDLMCSQNSTSVEVGGGNSSESLVSFQGMNINRKGVNGHDSGHSSTAQLSPRSQAFSEDGDLLMQSIDIVEDASSPETSGEISSSSYKRISVLQRHQQIREDPCITCSAGDRVKSNHWKKVSARLRKLVG